jgi:parallel beta-helix repeat protein
MLNRRKSVALVLFSFSLSSCIFIVTPEEGTITENPSIENPSPPLPRRTPAFKQILYVDSTQGTDSPAAGDHETQPFRTITYALTQSSPGTVIQLATGEYTEETGEAFPLKIKPGITLRGREKQQGEKVIIRGGGDYLSPTWGKQKVTLLPGDRTEIAGVTVTNPYLSGTGIWVESTAPTIRNNITTKNHREGIFVTGTGTPRIENNRIFDNGGNGISLTHEAGGEIRNNIIENTGFGLAIGGNSTPLVVNNQIRNNIDGFVISHSARPVLRDNVIADNRRDGLVAIGESQPDLGTETVAGKNTFKNNGRYDIHNAAQSQILQGVGNPLDDSRVGGAEVHIR